MKLKIETILLMMTLCLVSGCERMFMGERIDTNPVVTFDYLWQQVDERYSLFDVKEVDWGTMYDSLRPRVYNDMSDEELFSVCRDLLNSLNDGHVDLWSSTDVASSEAIFLQRYAQNNIDINTVALTYLGPHRHTTGGLTYNSIDSGRVLYIYYGSFSNKASANQMEYAISLYPDIDGIVFDIRQNGGGEIQNEWNLMSLLPDKKQLLYTTQLKSGKGHNDFGTPTAVYAPSNKGHKPFTKPFVLLTDRGCYSAASSFALSLKSYDNVTVMGDTTAGGLGIPAGGALPNGWYYRFGVSRIIAPDGINYENGVPPDQVVMLDPAATALRRDNIIDSACALIQRQKQK